MEGRSWDAGLLSGAVKQPNGQCGLPLTPSGLLQLKQLAARGLVSVSASAHRNDPAPASPCAQVLTARQMGKWVVTPAWLECSCILWKRANEDRFLVPL